MQEAIAEALLARDANEVPVGALVVSGDGAILARAGNAVERLSDPTAHAEILALRAAAHAVGNCRLEDCILLATLEPCLMCAGALVHARVAGLVYGALDPKAGGVSSCLDGLELPFLNHHVWHMGGVAEDRCAQLLREFFEQRRQAQDS
jgi:tRNA(adenine34) deaminase